jgi:hypothetical protein
MGGESFFAHLSVKGFKVKKISFFVVLLLTLDAFSA